jgi:parvulin-like peptidyl-prolyl isomerase
MIRYLLAIVLVSGSAVAQTAVTNDAVIARAGNVFISEREFQERFELTPGLYRHRKPQLEGEKLLMLYSMVAEKLLAQEATSRSLDTTAFLRTAVSDLTKLLVRDELYRQEVRAHVTITPSELRQGVLRARERRLVRFLYFEREEDARFIRAQLRLPVDLDRMVLDPTMRALKDTASVLWGDAEDAVEQAAYALDRSTVSPVVRAGDGFYILRLVSTGQDPVLAMLPSETLRERVESTLRMRKERIREAAFVEQLLTKQHASSPPATFRIVADTIARIFREQYTPPSMAFSPAMRADALARLARIAADTLIVAGDHIWTVAGALDRLVQRGFSVSGDSVRGTAMRLYTIFREWAHQELLAQEGLARGLDRHPEVVRRLAPWRDHYLAGMVERRISEATGITDADVYGYLRSADASVQVPEVRLRVLHANTLEQMQGAFRLMEQGKTFEEAIVSVSTDSLHGDTGFFPVTDRPPLGFLAAKLEPGQFYGPFRDSSGYTYLQLLDKRAGRDPADTTGNARLAAARTEVQKLKTRRNTTLFIAQTASRLGFEVYQDRLRMVQVTPLPMIAYRLLGFGGRMFEVPFVQPQTDWLNEAPSREVILP